MNKAPRVGLIGYGYWGPNLLRNLIADGRAEVAGVVDASTVAREKCGKLYPHVKTFEDAAEFLAATRPDAVIIATPPATHSRLAVRCLEAGAHVLIEKPLAMSSRECDEILAAATKAGRQVMVDHTFAYHPAVEYLAEQVRNGGMGELHYYDSVRVNLGGFQPKTNVLWDLAPHDLSIIDVLTGGLTPTKVSAVGIKHFNQTVDNLCYVHLTYANNFVAHLHLNWVAPVKVRTIMVGGSKKMAIYDDNLVTEKVKVYDKGVSILQQSNTETDFRVNYRSGDMTAPAIPGREALAGMMGKFLNMVTTGEKPVSDGLSGRRVVQILELAAASMLEGGNPIDFQ